MNQLRKCAVNIPLATCVVILLGLGLRLFLTISTEGYLGVDGGA